MTPKLLQISAQVGNARLQTGSTLVHKPRGIQFVSITWGR
jgi:hypothetical protein